MKWPPGGSTVRGFALATLSLFWMANVGLADDGFWARLAQLTMRKGISVNFKRAAETFALPTRDHAYPAYQVFYEERDGTTHHLTAYEDALKVVHLIVTNFDRESGAYRLGHGYLVSADGSLLAATEGFRVEKTAPSDGRWAWAQTSIPAVAPSFQKEASYWRGKIERLETEPDRPASAAWERRCEQSVCRWWNGREKKWAE